MQTPVKDVTDLHATVGREKLRETIDANIVPLEVQAEEPAAKSWLDVIDDSVVTSTQLAALQLKPRKRLLGDWLCEGDLGIIYAFRGVGKTWFALLLAKALSEAGSVGGLASARTN